MKGWKHKKTPIIVGNEKTPTKMESGQVIINKKATKQNLNKLIEINNDGLDKEKSKISTDGKDGGLLKGPAHYDKNGNSLGGIPVVVDGSKKIEVEGDEFVVNKEASQKHWKELSRINQSAGNGVPIKPNDLGIDTDPEEYKEGGRIIQFNPNDLPSQWIYNYAKKIKEKYPKVWDKGGNIFGNEAFVNLERVIKRGYWADSEEWMYIKWRSYVARHKKDYRIEGVVAMLKWIDKVDKGWDYMKNIIEAEIEKKYPKKKTGGVVTYKNKYNKKFGYDKNESHDLKEIAKDTEVSKRGLQKIYNKGVGAYKTNSESVRPNVKSKEQWAMARVYSAVMGGKAAKVDAKELKMIKGGGVEFIPEKKGTLIRGNEIIKYFEKVNGNYKLVFYTLNETKGKVPTICDSFGYCKELDTDNVTSKQLVELIKKNNLMEYGGGVEHSFEISKIKELVESNLDVNKYKIITEDKDALVFASKYKDIRIEFRLNIIKDAIWFGGFSRIEISSVSLADPLLRYQNTSARRVVNKKINIRKGVNSYRELEKLLKNFLNKNEELKMQTGGMMQGEPPKNFENVLYKELANRYEYGGGVKDIRCKCGWGWNKNQSDESDLYICHKCGNDNEMKYGGELAKGIKVEAEHQNTFNKVYAHKLNPMQATEEVAKEHIKEDKNYYSKLAKMEKFNTGGVATGFEDGDIIRGEYYPGIYGNFLVVNAGADAVKVKNLLTGIDTIQDFRDFTLFLKKGTGQTTTTQPIATTKGSGNDFEFEIGDKVIYKGNNENATIDNRSEFAGGNFYDIIFDSGKRASSAREMDLELQKVVMPTEILPPAQTQTSQPVKPKFVPMDFKPFLQDWVNSNFINSTDLTKKEIVKDTITDFILDVEAVDGNQTIKLDKEAQILDNIDNYIN